MKYLLVNLFIYVIFLNSIKCDWWSDQIGTECYNYPRVRQSWCDLTYKQKVTWIAITKLMKATKIPGYSDNYYKSFVDMHSVATNSNLSHGTTYFFLWHRIFMWHVENCFRFFAYTYRTQLNLTVSEACSFSAPYWAWEVDYESDPGDSYIPQDHSCIWDYPELLGPAPTHPPPGEVKTGSYCASNWTTNFACNNNSLYFTNPAYGALTYTLKRAFDVNYNFVTGPAQLMHTLCTTPTYSNFEAFVEGGPHSYVHLWLGYVMKDMRSPEEPIFFLHHGNIERIHTLYQDCWDYEFVVPSQMTTTHYKANNPNPFPAYPTASSYKRDVYGNIGNVGIDSIMPYWWKAYMIGSSYLYTFVDIPWMKNGTWPSPRAAYFVGYNEAPTKGWGNIMYTYGNDNLVNTLGSCCTSNTRWTFFPTTPSYTISKKREASTKFEITEESNVTETPMVFTESGKNQSNTHIVYSSLTLQMSELKKKGLCITDALEALAIKECQESAKQTFPPDMDDWMKMNGLVPEQFVRICEKDDPDQGVVFSEIQDGGTHYRRVDVMTVVISCIAGVVLLAAIIVGIVILVRKEGKKGRTVTLTDAEYLNMSQDQIND